MSTKIYNGYRITSLAGGRPDAFALSADLRDALLALYREAYTRQLAELACLQVDLADRAPDRDVRSERSPLLAAHAVIEEASEIIEKRGRRVPLLDFQCEITFLADRAEPEGPLYALLYTERDDYLTAFQSIEGVEFWGYWNNTDPQEGVTEEEWEQRRQVWDRILGWDAPVTRGLGWKLLSDYDGLHPTLLADDDVTAAVPDNHARACRLAVSLVSSVKVVGDGPGAVSFRDAREVRAERERIVAEVEPLLRDLTVADLRQLPETPNG